MTPQSASFDDDVEGGEDEVVELADVVVEETTVVKVVGAGATAAAITFAFATLLTMPTSLLPELVEPESVLGGVDGVDVGGADEEAGAGAGAGLLPEEPPPHMSASSVE